MKMSSLNELRNFFNHGCYNMLIESLITEASLTDTYEKYFKDKMSNNEFMTLAKIDPSYNPNKQDNMGKFTRWILKQYINNETVKNNLGELKQYLDFYYKNQNFFNIKIKELNSLEELKNIIDEYNKLPNEIKKIESEKARQGTDIVYNSNEWMIVIPRNFQASQYWGKDTEWCTKKSEDDYNKYTKQGPLYINIDKTKGRKYQFHLESEQCKDEDDMEISFSLHEDDTVGEYYNTDSVTNITRMPSNVEKFYKENDKELYELISRTLVVTKISKIKAHLISVDNGKTYKLKDRNGDDVEMAFDLMGDYELEEINNLRYILTLKSKDGYNLLYIVYTDTNHIDYFGSDACFDINLTYNLQGINSKMIPVAIKTDDGFTIIYDCDDGCVSLSEKSLGETVIGNTLFFKIDNNNNYEAYDDEYSLITTLNIENIEDYDEYEEFILANEKGQQVYYNTKEFYTIPKDEIDGELDDNNSMEY